MSKADPSFGRDAELHEYAISDLSVEEQLASGASVDDLVAAGVLYDDYDPENDPDYFFTPLEPVEEIPVGPAMPEEEFEALKKKTFAFSNLAEEFRKKSARLRAEGVAINSPEFSAFTEEFRKKAAQLRAERLTQNASDRVV